MFCECKCKCNHLDYTIHKAIALRKHLGRTVKWLFMCFSMCSHNQVVTAVVVHLCATRRKKWIKAPFGHYFGHHHITPYFMLGTTVGWGLTSPGNPQDIFLRVWQKKSNYICLIAFSWVSLQFSSDISFFDYSPQQPRFVIRPKVKLSIMFTPKFTLPNNML